MGGVFVGVGHGVTGLVTGLGGLVGFQGWDVMGRSWKGLGALAIVAASPQVMVSNQGFPGYQPGEIQGTVTGMGKSLIAYDQWASDPAQAAGESVVNIATFFIPVGGGAAGTAKAASLAGKTHGVVGVAGTAAKVTDVLKASRVADVVAGVRTTLDLRLNNAANALHTALGGPDRALAGPGRRHLPEAPVPHTPDLHATTIHPDPGSVAPHPAGHPTPHETAPPHGATTPTETAPGAQDAPTHSYGYDSNGAIKGTPGDPVTTLHDRVAGGLQDVLHDPRTAGQIPPGHDPLHGLTPQQYFDTFGTGTSFSDGAPRWDWVNQAPNNGAVLGSEKPAVLGVGDVIDRYGPPRGNYVSPEGTPYPSRGLPADSIGSGYHVYEVVKPIPVRSSLVERAFGELGGGKQYLLDKPLSWYLSQGDIVEVFN